MPKVSILTPAFNAAKYLAETIDSVLAQTFQDFEMIIVDDGSTDRTKDVAESYARRFPDKIRYMYQMNAGPAAARNTAIKNSTGEYLALLDADDLWLPNRLEEGVKLLDQRQDVGLVHSRTKRLIEGIVSPGVERNLQYLSGWFFQYLVTRTAHISCLTAMFRRQCLDTVGLFDEAQECIGVEDRDLWIRISKYYPVQFINQELGVYRVISSGISRNTERMVEGRMYVISKNCPGFRNFMLRHYAIACAYKEYADEYMQFGKYAEARKKYFQAIKCWPFYIWPWINYVKCILRTGVADV